MYFWSCPTWWMATIKSITRLPYFTYCKLPTLLHHFHDGVIIYILVLYYWLLCSLFFYHTCDYLVHCTDISNIQFSILKLHTVLCFMCHLLLILVLMHYLVYYWKFVLFIAIYNSCNHTKFGSYCSPVLPFAHLDRDDLHR